MHSPVLKSIHFTQALLGKVGASEAGLQSLQGRLGGTELGLELLQVAFGLFWCAHTYILIHTHTHSHTLSLTHTHTHTHTHIHTHTLTYTHIDTQQIKFGTAIVAQFLQRENQPYTQVLEIGLHSHKGLGSTGIKCRKRNLSTKQKRLDAHETSVDKQ